MTVGELKQFSWFFCCLCSVFDAPLQYGETSQPYSSALAHKSYLYIYDAMIYQGYNQSTLCAQFDQFKCIFQLAFRAHKISAVVSTDFFRSMQELFSSKCTTQLCTVRIRHVKTTLQRSSALRPTELYCLVAGEVDTIFGEIYILLVTV